MRKRILIFTVTSVLCWVLWFMCHPITGYDFTQYVTAILLFKKGGNPYDPRTMLEFQRSFLGRPDLSEAVMYWSPPWGLFFVAPAWLDLPLIKMIEYWNAISIFCLGACAIILTLYLLQPFAKQQNYLLSLVAAIICSPVLNILHFGQISAVLVVSMTLCVISAVNKKFILAGISASMMLFKPHLLMLASFIVLAEAFYFDWAKRVVSGALIGTFALICMQEIVFPHSTSLWLKSFLDASPSPYATPRGDWLCATLSGFLRSLYGGKDNYPTIIVPLVSIFIAVWAVVRRKMHPSNPLHCICILTLSLICAPYGWYYDQSILMPMQFLLAAHCLFEAGADRYLYALLVWNCIAIIAYLYLVTGQHQLWWYPLGLLCIAWSADIKSKSYSKNIPLKT